MEEWGVRDKCCFPNFQEVESGQQHWFPKYLSLKVLTAKLQKSSKVLSFGVFPPSFEMNPLGRKWPMSDYPVWLERLRRQRGTQTSYSMSEYSESCHHSTKGKWLKLVEKIPIFADFSLIIVPRNVPIIKYFSIIVRNASLKVGIVKSVRKCPFFHFILS